MRYEGSLAQRKATSTAVTSKLGPPSSPSVEKQLTSACVYYGRERCILLILELFIRDGDILNPGTKLFYDDLSALGGVEPRIAQPTCVVPHRRGFCTLVLFISPVKMKIEKVRYSRTTPNSCG